MSDFIEVASLDQIPTGTSTLIKITDKSIALFNIQGTVYAIDDSCVHAGASLGSGKLEGKMVTCRGHGMKFDVTTGYAGGVPGYGVATYPVQVKDGKILLSITPNPTANPKSDSQI